MLTSLIFPESLDKNYYKKKYLTSATEKDYYLLDKQ